MDRTEWTEHNNGRTGRPGKSNLKVQRRLGHLVRGKSYCQTFSAEMNTWGKSCSLAVCKQTVGRTKHVSQVGRKGELPRHLFYIMYGFSFTSYVWISFRHCLRIKPWFSSRKDLHTRRGLKCALGYDSLIALKWACMVDRSSEKNQFQTNLCLGINKA